ncbi:MULTISPECIES: TetR/AcrR family transcriptional regulator [unclassified Sinorhizobium]|uniref:TetR/AcrR family transcriptional regulator n=1 Tax=unclassified Sinorhizobium TaxID=2613772 RepID=UPI003524A6C4
MTTATLTSSRLRGRPREFDLDDALDKALRVFSERGYYAASISELTEAMKLTSGSVYKAFGDKRGIFIAVLDRYRLVRRQLMEEGIAAVHTGHDKVRQMLIFYADSSHGVVGRQGCLVVGSATELALFDAEVAERVAAAFDKDEQLLDDLIRLGQADGSIPAAIDSRDAARTLLCLMKGMRLAGKTGRSREEMTAVAETAMKILA